MSFSDLLIVVDEEDRLRSALEGVLGAERVEVARHATALGALSACVLRAPLCIVTDMDLPDYDGLWLAASVRANLGAVASTPIVLLGHPIDDELRARALEAGVDVLLPKPVRLDELCAQVRALLAMSGRLRAEAVQRAARGDDRVMQATASSRSGVRRRVEPPRPGQAVREEVVPSARPDPRAEPVDEVPTRIHVWRK